MDCSRPEKKMTKEESNDPGVSEQKKKTKMINSEEKAQKQNKRKKMEESNDLEVNKQKKMKNKHKDQKMKQNKEENSDELSQQSNKKRSTVNGDQKKMKLPGERGRDKPPRLDPQTVGYFRRVSERLEEGFSDPEERDLFVENVLSEVSGKARLVALNPVGSSALQRLLSLAAADQVARLLLELGGASAEKGAELGFRGVACDPCGGHVMQSALRQAHRCSGEELAEVTEVEEEPRGLLEAQVLRVCGVVRESLVEFVQDAYGSHVLRTLIVTLAGCRDPETHEGAHGKKSRGWSALDLEDFEAPVSFWWELKHLSESFVEILKVCVSSVCASAALQTLLSVCHRKRPVLCRKLSKSIVGYLTSLSSAPGVSPLLVFLKDLSGSRLLQVLFSVSQKPLLRQVYQKHLRGQLMPLALHPSANFPVQSFIAASAPYRLFLEVFEELIEGFEAILAAFHMGVVVQLMESCVHWEEKQNVLLQRLLQAFHCSEPATRQTSCLPLFLSLLTYDVYYSTETAEGDAGTKRSLSICYHGSRLVQALAQFSDRSLLMNSLHSLSSADLYLLASDRCGSYALQKLILGCSDKSRSKILSKMHELLVDLACSACGSRLLEAVWNSATISQKQSIAEKLVPSESRLRSDQFASHTWSKFGLSSFSRRRRDWMEVQSGETKKRKIFCDILTS